MCSKYKKIGRVIALPVALVLILALGSVSVPAQVTCGCNTTSCGISFATTNGIGISPGATVAAGTVIRATVQVSPQAVCPPPNAGQTPCEFHHGALVLTHPDGFVEVLSADLPTTTGALTPLTFVSTHDDVMGTSGFKLWTMVYGNPANPAPDALDGSWITPAGDQLGASATCAQGLSVVNPAICITKACVNTCTPFGQPIPVSGTVSNCGDETLAGVNVVDVPAINFTFLSNGVPITAPFTLGPNGVVTFSGSYTPADTTGCGPFTDVATASAIGAVTATPVSASASATCHVQAFPAITLTKDCYKTGFPGVRTLLPGDTYVEVFTVANPTNVPLTGVVINDSVVGMIAIGDLPPFSMKSVTNGPITPPANYCGPITDRATATGNNICPPDEVCPSPRTVSSSEVTCTVTVICPPGIVVYKQVVCELPGPTCATFGNPATDNKSASGVKGDSVCPAFCYQITLVNTGQVALTNVIVSDPTISLASCSFPTTLAVGQTASCIIGGVTLCQNTANTVTATGQSTASGETVTSTDTVQVTVVPIRVTCELILTSTFDLDGNAGNNHVTLPANEQNAPIGVRLVISNPSAVDCSVTISGLPPLVDCADDVTPVPPPQPVTVAAGGTATLDVGCVLVSCPAGLNMTVTVVGTALANTAHPCIYTSQGVAVTTAASTCPASVTCEQPVTCRVTGGGILYPGTSDSSCITVNTLNFPLQSDTGLDLVKVTHGGQLGAPFSHQNCGNPLSDLCIRGQWQHVRHYQGQGNPRDVVTSIHSANPNVKIGYDSLLCACLGCCDPTTGAFIPATQGPLIKKFQLCNPDDHKICGPQPRPSPANAIIFSGLAQVSRATDNGTDSRTTEWLVFRVYIEDRSEPGGHHPKGAINPADVYVFQAWRTGILVATGKNKKGQNINALNGLRSAVAQDSCDFLNALSSGAATGQYPAGLQVGSLPSFIVDQVQADIVDQGPMLSGNHQIHPSTAATCP